MSGYLAERIEKPKFWHISRLIRGRGNRKPYVIGFDSEAENGRPFLFQFSLPDTPVEATQLRIVGTGRHDGLMTFLTFIHETCTRKDTEYLIYGWNVAYEFTQILGDLPTEVATLSEFVLDNVVLRSVSGLALATYNIHVWNDKRFMLTFENVHTKRRVRLLDGMGFYKTGLDNAGKMLGLGAKIVLQSKKFTRKSLEAPLFLEYAKQDAWLTRKIGEEIVSLHETYDVPTCISAPHFAARVFRRHFLNGTLELPSEHIEQAGLFSYHGGKNGYYLNGPKHFSDLYQYDITSAYPEAMRQLPDIEKAQWIDCREYLPGVHALWNVTMQYKSCRYHGGMSHAEGWLSTGYVDGVWLTSYELDAILAEGEATLIACHGYVMTGTPGGSLQKYVDTFFALKAKAEGAAREAAKLFLNSLYGKFFQKVPLGACGYFEADVENAEVRFVATDPTQLYDWQAGGLYHPPIASLITGYVRAKIHRLEHKYDAIMTSTDGFFAMRPPDPIDIGKHLGGLTVSRGDLSIWRERLYIFTPANPHGGCVDGCAKDHRKYALHGFRGSVNDLAKIPLTPGSYSYDAQQMVTLKLSAKKLQGTYYPPGTFAQLTYTLALEPAAENTS